MNEKKLQLIAQSIIVILVIVLGILGFFLIQQYQEIKQLDIVTTHPFSQPIAPIKKVSLIETWMTFDYINHSFNLPANYLQTNLDIKNIYYPRVIIGHYAKSIGINPETFTSSVRQAVQQYLEQNS